MWGLENYYGPHLQDYLVKRNSTMSFLSSRHDLKTILPIPTFGKDLFTLETSDHDHDFLRSLSG